MKGARIAIILDNPVRDLPGLSLLALELCRRGSSVYLVPMYLAEEIFALAPDFVLLNYLRKISRGLVAGFLENEIPYGVLDTEGGPVSGDLEGFKYLCDDAEVNAGVSSVCCWGTFSAEDFFQRKIYSPESIRVTGQPRFDLYSSPWRNAVLQMAPYIEPSLQPYVLICSNFALTTCQYGSREKMRDAVVKNYGIEAGKFDAMQDEEEVAIDQMVDCILGLAKQFPKVNFVYRPHPFEDASSYSDRFQKCDNIRVIKQGNVGGWMIAAKAVIQLTCTTCYDAWFAGTPSFRPGWIAQTSGIGYETAVNDVAESMEDLTAKLSSVFEQTYQKEPGEVEKDRGLVGRYFGIPDGRAHVRVADSIIEAVNFATRESRRQKLARKKAAIFSDSEFRSSLLGRLRIFLFSKLGYQPGWRPKDLATRKEWIEKYLTSPKYFSDSMIRSWIGALSAAAGMPCPQVHWATERNGYPFGGKYGKSIVVEPI